MKSKVELNWNGFQERVEFSIEYALIEMGKMITRYVRASLMRPGTGRWYSSKRRRRYGAEVVGRGRRVRWKKFFRSKEARTLFRTPNYFIYGLKHRASVPGRTPAPDTETLRDSIDFDIVRRGGGWKTLLIKANAPYAYYLEMGTSTVRPRPFLRPAVNRYNKLFGKEVSKAFRMKINSIAASKT